jgi:hypothetical protein
MRAGILALLAVASVFRLSAQAPSDKKMTVTGKVVNSVTKEPIAGAVVTVSLHAVRLDATGIASPQVRRALTDDTGRFAFADLWFEGISLQAACRGFRSTDGTDAAHRFLSPEQAHDVTIPLVPLGVIHGRVVSQEGEPVAGLRVQALKIETRDGRSSWREYASKVTDDRGEYRLWHLSPGRYYLKVSGRPGTFTSFSDSVTMADSVDAFVPVYYPSASAIGGAEVIRLHPAQTMRADFVVEARNAYRIRGVVRGFARDSRPTIRLLRGEDAVANRTVFNSATGAFEVFDVTPGQYVVQAYRASGRPLVLGEAQVTVADRDVAGVFITASAAIEVRGTVEFSGTGSVALRNNMPTQRLATVRARTTSRLTGPGVGAESSAGIGVDGSFRLRLLSGRYELQATTPGFYNASIQCGTVDVLADGLAVGEVPPPEIKILMISGGGRIEGIVAGVAAEEVPTVVLARKYGATYIVTHVVAPAGQFAAGDLAPGEYLLYAIKTGSEIEYRNPTVLAEMAKNAVSVYVRDGSREQVKLKLAVEEQP